MRPCHVKRLMVALGALALVLALGSTVASATTACEQACMDQFDDDVDQCDADLAAKQADLAQQEIDCQVNGNGDPPGLKGCLNSVAKQQRNAVKKHQQCLKQADTKLRNCLNQCDASPA